MTSLARTSSSSTFIGGAACVGLAALIVAVGAAQIRGREASGGAEFTLEVPDVDTIAPGATEDDFPMPPADDGDAASHTAAPAQAGGRTAQPAEPPTDTSSPAPEPVPHFNAAVDPPVAPVDPVALARPIVLAAGRFSVGGKMLELSGIVPVAVNRQCTDISGEGWPCGRMARTAFANLVRGRTIDCDVPSIEWTGTAQASCTLAGKDLSQWLAENGWAEAEPGSPLAAAADAARQAGLGLHSPDPRRTRSRSGSTGAN